jgi:oligopeptide transport system substrate-binding protein
MGSDSSSRNALILEKVQGDLQTQLGLQTELTLVDWKSYLQGLGSNPPSLFRFAWMMPFADPILLLRVFTTGNPNNFGGFSDPVYDEWVARIARLPRGAERTRWTQRAQLRLVSEQVALVPLYHYIQTSAVSPRLQGFRVSPYGTLEFRELRLGKAPGHS